MTYILSRDYRYHWRRWLKAIFVCFLLAGSSLEAARNRFSYEEDQSVVTREILDSLTDLRHEINNHETEIRIFEEKFKSQEEIIDSLRQLLADSLKNFKEILRAQTNTIDSKFSQNENAAQGLTNDLKTHATDVTGILGDYKQRIADLEKTLELQNRNLENMQAAMKSLTELLQTKEMEPIAETALNGVKIHRVKAGDSLEKIARLNNTSIKKLKELNNLSGDQIIVGQKLQLPE
jgi:hypothetical protein